MQLALDLICILALEPSMASACMVVAPQVLAQLRETLSSYTSKGDAQALRDVLLVCTNLTRDSGTAAYFVEKGVLSLVAG
jgi:hypothetical protein